MDSEEKKEFYRQFKDANELSAHLQAIFKEGVEHLLEAELDEHLGYEKYASTGRGSGNSRNGKSSKQLQTELGPIELEVPRDRNGSFEPKLVPRHSRVMAVVEEKIISLYAKGMSVRDISEQIEEIYGVSLSDSSVSNITNKILPQVREWQDRPLNRQYLMVWMDGMVFKVRDGRKVINKCLHLVLGLNTEGRKEVLGMWISQKESASFWLGVLNDLRARGVEDVLIFVTDNLKGLPEAIEGSFPEARTQLCIVHQVRSSAKYVAYKERKRVISQMREIYKAPSLDAAQEALRVFKGSWNAKYPYAIKSWETNWERLTTYFDYPPEIRTIMYTTNVIESFNSAVRKFTRNKMTLPSNEALLKAVFLAQKRISRNWNKRIPNWPLVLTQFKILYGDRIEEG